MKYRRIEVLTEEDLSIIKNNFEYKELPKDEWYIYNSPFEHIIDIRIKDQDEYHLLKLMLPNYNFDFKEFRLKEKE